MNTPLPNIASDMIDALLAIDNREEMYAFLRDLLTENEIREFANRFRVAEMLEAKISYVDIEKQTKMSSTTIARIARFLRGENRGYTRALAHLHHHHLHASGGICVDDA